MLRPSPFIIINEKINVAFSRRTDYSIQNYK